MVTLKLGSILEDKPVKVRIELPAAPPHDLVAFAEVLARETGRPVTGPVKLMALMNQRFIATDRGFAKARCRS